MPLDTKDLAAIEEIVSRQIETKVPSIVEVKLGPIKSDISELKKDVTELKKDVTEVKRDMFDVKKDVSEMKKDVAILATLNQLEDIKKDPRLRVLYKTDVS